MTAWARELESSSYNQSFPEGVRVLPVGGHPSHLDWDFGQAPPLIISMILQSCLRSRDHQPISNQEILDWSINRRLQALLAVTIASRDNNLSLSTHCTNKDCAEILDLDLNLNAFTKSNEVFFVKVAPEQGTVLILRFPTGLDQVNWLEKADAAKPPSPSQMAKELIVKVNDEEPNLGESLASEWLEAISEALDQNDPFTNFKLKTQCPFCENKFLARFNLEEFLLKSVRQKWYQLLDEVHHLAMSYHWKESDIFKMPAQRRGYYLDRIEEAR